MSDMDVYVVVGLAVSACTFGSIGALIAQSKNRPLSDGFTLGFILGILGVAIASVLSRKPSPAPGLPSAPDGRYAVRCVACNAVQNVIQDDTAFQCWQCRHWTILRSAGEPDGDGRCVIECPGCDKRALVMQDSFRYRCPGCSERHNLTLSR